MSYLKNYIVQKIDENQTIKRLARYMTTTPTFNKGMTYDGRLINQPDLTDSLLKSVENDQQATVKEEVLSPHAFTEDVLDERRLTIYVHSPRSIFNLNAANNRPNYGTDELLGKHLFYVEIVYPIEYNALEPFGNERSMMIACEVLDMLDNLVVEGDIREQVGDCIFKVEGEITDLRLSKSGYMILTLPIWSTVAGIRHEDLSDY